MPVHFSVIQENGYRSLNEGETVEFDLLKGPKGFQAGNVVRGLESYTGFTPAQLRAVERDNALALFPRLKTT